MFSCGEQTIQHETCIEWSFSGELQFMETKMSRIPRSINLVLCSVNFCHLTFNPIVAISDIRNEHGISQPYHAYGCLLGFCLMY